MKLIPGEPMRHATNGFTGSLYYTRDAPVCSILSLFMMPILSASVIVSVKSCPSESSLRPAMHLGGLQVRLHAIRSPASTAARRTGTAWAGVRWRGQWPHAGAIRRIIVAAPGQQAAQRQHRRRFGDAPRDLCLGQAFKLERKRHVVLHVQLRIQRVTLEHHADAAFRRCYRFHQSPVCAQVSIDMDQLNGDDAHQSRYVQPYGPRQLVSRRCSCTLSCAVCPMTDSLRWQTSNSIPLSINAIDLH